ncbi:ClpXP adapter SpxH family protein [Bacillus andreraoultii]|uniref:ClpXP adapter SpxH family protein n=1 Tax=Bacillus andreraoultii TaxID=1499685 RepID=UPI0005A75A9C|nr:ClpXP adapter SpxH family protein [Bacillus andreraoultii]
MIDKNRYEYNLSSFVCGNNRPLELYLFIDPLCSDCFSLEPVIKKLQFEYGHYFSLTYVLSGKLTNLNKDHRKARSKLEKTINRKCIDCGELEAEQNVNSPYLASIAVKAAELQGKKAGIRFLRKLQEYVYLKGENISKLDTLIICAKEAQLDVDEFVKDIHSESTSHAFQCDLKITNEMDVTETPTIVFFNNNVEEEGLKLSGVNSYEVYLEVMKEILGDLPISHSLPPLLSFIEYHEIVSTQDIAYVYDLPHLKVELEMKKLMLQQIVEKLNTEHGTFWRYIHGNVR